MHITSSRAPRALGQPADLDLDFTSSDRPSLVTALLTQTGAADAAYWWTQAVGRRTQALLDVLAATERRETLGLTAVCAATGCAQTFEFELPLHGLPQAKTDDDDTIAVTLGPQRRVRLRLPRGDDLRRWRAARPATRVDAVRTMCASLLVEGEVDERDEGAIAAAIAAHDPLVDFTVTCTCPACDAPAEVAVDLEGLALRRLARAQRELLREVHVLAAHYGWREADVLAVPAARRAQYRALIEEHA